MGVNTHDPPKQVIVMRKLADLAMFWFALAMVAVVSLLSPGAFDD
jgi:hypothetical protein